MIRIARRLLLFTIICGLLVGTFGMPAQSMAATELTYNVWIPQTGLVMETFVNQWVDEVEKGTNGSIKINIPAASLAPPPRSYDMVMSGVADLAFFGVLYKRTEWHLPLITDIPFTGGPTGEATAAALWKTYKKFFEAANEFKGIKPLSFWVLQQHNFLSSKAPILSVADFKRQKVRVEPGTQVDMLKAIGVPVVAAQGMKAFEMISKGTVDATAMPFFAANDTKVGNYIKYATIIPGGHFRATFVFFMNGEMFNGLSDSEKKVIEAASGERLSRRISKTLDAHEEDVKKQWTEKGTKIETASPEFVNDLKAKWAFVGDNWIEGANKKGVDGKAALEFYVKEAQGK